MPKLRVLARNRSVLNGIERDFQKNGIKYKMQGTRSFKDRREIKDFLGFWIWYRNPCDVSSLARFCKSMGLGLGEKILRVNIGTLTSALEAKTIDDVEALAAPLKRAGNLVRCIGRVGVAESLPAKFEALLWMHEAPNGRPINESSCIKRLILEDEHDEETGKCKHRAESVDFLYQSVSEGQTIDEFLDSYCLNPDEPEDESSDDIILQTIHSSKGQESDYVAIVGFSQDMIPSFYARDDDKQLEEERRLLYVAISRAKKGVYLLHSERRMQFGQVNFLKESPFLKEIS